MYDKLKDISWGRDSHIHKTRKEMTWEHISAGQSFSVVFVFSVIPQTNEAFVYVLRIMNKYS